MTDVITLKNGLKFVVLDKIAYEGEKYLYLSSYDDDINIIFARLVDNIVEPIEDGDLILKLAEIIRKHIEK
mgnify:CR=1 FL=1